MRKPNFFIVGSRKCGTTALYNYLRIHPDIFMAPKEAHFFGSDLLYKDLIWKNNINEYLKLFNPVKKQKMLGDASVNYILSTKAAKEIKEFNPQAKIIIMLRNPVDQMYSSYHQLLALGNETIGEFEKALDAEEKRKSGKVFVGNVNKKELLYRYAAHYYNQVKRYLDVFEKRNVLIIITEEFKQNIHGTYKNVLGFLGVDSSFKLDPNFINRDNIRNSSQRPKNVLIQRIMHVLTLQPKILTMAGKILPIKDKSIIYSFLRKINTKYVPYPPMSNSLRKKLTKEFIPEIKRLETLINRDLSIWYKN